MLTLIAYHTPVYNVLLTAHWRCFRPHVIRPDPLFLYVHVGPFCLSLWRWPSSVRC